MPVNPKPIKLEGIWADQLGYMPLPDADSFGVEVELEGRKITTTRELIVQDWARHIDGSLRVNQVGAEACEYVFKKPLNLSATIKAVSNLLNHLNTSPGTEVFESYRTSIHVHINCLNDSLRVLVNFITLAIIFDELFVSQNGDTRIGNNFCLRTRDAEGQITDLVNSICQYGSLGGISGNHRYSSVNLASLTKFGTIEFRSLECTTDIDRVLHWIKTIQALKAAAREYNNPRDIVAKFSRKGPLGFMISTLGAQYGKYASVPGIHNMLSNGMRLAQDFAYCSEWKEPEPGYIKSRTGRSAKLPLQFDLEAQPINWENFAQQYQAPQPQPLVVAADPFDDDLFIDIEDEI